MTLKYQTVARVGEIPEGEGRAFEVENNIVAVFLLDGQYSAINDMCPHMGASLAAGFLNPDNCTVSCSWHAWRFNVKDGTWVDNPRVKTNVFEVRIVGDEIQVAIPSRPDAKPDDRVPQESESPEKKGNP